MFNLQTLTAKARELRGNVVKATTTKGTRTMTPVYEREEQRKLRERIQQTQPDWVLLWWDIATVTGWRTSDVCNFRYSCINWETGIATIIVAKQTKAAEARATRKGIEIVRQQRKDAARLAGDHIAYMQWDSVSCDQLAAGMTEEEQAIVIELVAKAKLSTIPNSCRRASSSGCANAWSAILSVTTWYFPAARLKVTVASLWKVALAVRRSGRNCTTSWCGLPA